MLLLINKKPARQAGFGSCAAPGTDTFSMHLVTVHLGKNIFSTFGQQLFRQLDTHSLGVGRITLKIKANDFLSGYGSDQAGHLQPAIDERGKSGDRNLTSTLKPMEKAAFRSNRKGGFLMVHKLQSGQQIRIAYP